MREFRLFRIGSVEVTATTPALYASLILWVVMSLIATILVFGPSRVPFLGLGAVILHWFSALVHQFGHMWAAARTGYPMSGIRLGTMWFLAGSRYPKDEPELPGKTHIQRALGGPTFSIILAVISGLIALAVPSTSPSLKFIFGFLLLENLFVFTIGAFIPLGFNDGSTILTWRGK